jgi:prepilin-type N-terminal cleavage/methylation domain-containing protein
MWDHKTNKNSQQAGFTIVELMIALSVLSVLLVMSSVILIQIGNLYSKGVNASKIQDATRSVTADLTGTLEFSGQAPAGGCGTPSPKTTCYTQVTPGEVPVYSYCIGKVRYSYILGHKLSDSPRNDDTYHESYHVLWRDTMKTTDKCPPLKLLDPGAPNDSQSSGDGYEMVPHNVRLTRFKVEQTPAASGIYNIDVWMAYGDDDLVNTQGDSGAQPGHSTCSGDRGTQYCAVSEISTSATRRLN